MNPCNVLSPQDSIEIPTQGMSKLYTCAQIVECSVVHYQMTKFEIIIYIFFFKFSLFRSFKQTEKENTSSLTLTNLN